LEVAERGDPSDDLVAAVNIFAEVSDFLEALREAELPFVL
jgi:hypothetical protein